MKKIIQHFLFVLLTAFLTNGHTGGSIVGSGDEVRITVYEHPDLSTITRVSDNGNISFPLIGQVKVTGMSEREVETKIAGLLSKGNFVRSPQVSVIVQSFNSRQTSVLGFVNRPGKYPIEIDNSLVDILAQAGGLSTQAGDKVIIIKKDSKKRIVVDIVDVFSGNNISSIQEVNDGDMIYVPKMEVFYIYGQVQRPGIYRLERDMNVMQALSVGGSITSRGSEKGIKIRRKDKSGKNIEIPAAQTDALHANDVIYVEESLF